MDQDAGAAAQFAADLRPKLFADHRRDVAHKDAGVQFEHPSGQFTTNAGRRFFQNDYDRGFSPPSSLPL